jgi:hypothetical protein
MTTAPLLTPAVAVTGEPPEVEIVGFVRLRSCARCGSRRRSLMEAGGMLHARCLGCGGDLGPPLGTERQPPLTVVGRGGQAAPGR